MQILYCFMCLKITKDVVLKHEIDGKVGIHFYYVNCSFRKERCDSLRETICLKKEKEN